MPAKNQSRYAIIPDSSQRSAGTGGNKSAPKKELFDFFLEQIERCKFALSPAFADNAGMIINKGP